MPPTVAFRGARAHRARGWAALALLLAAGRISVPVARASDVTPLPDAKTRPAHLLFAGVPWRTPGDSLPALLGPLGYKEVEGSRARDRVHFTGRLFERFATIDAWLDDQRRLARWEITIPARGERDDYEVQRPIYDDAVTEMISKHGRRRSAVDRFRFPSRKGDGHEARDLRDELATIRSVWESRAQDRLTIEMDPRINVRLTYESARWREVVGDRRRRKARDL